MRPFAYARPRSKRDLFAMLGAEGDDARLLAGGTDLVVRLRRGDERPRLVVDLKHVADLDAGVAPVDGVLRVGARAVMTDLVESPAVRRQFPALAEAAHVVGSVQIRNRATLAGNICNASPAADTAPALLVYGAMVNVDGPSGPRHVPVAAFFAGRGRTALAAGEIVESIDLPIPAVPTGAAFGRITRRYGVDLATMNVCCAVDAAGRIRFAYGAVAPTPVLVDDLPPHHAGPAAEDALVERALACVSPISDVRGSRDYRLAMIDVMTRRALRRALDSLARAPGTAGEAER